MTLRTRADHKARMLEKIRENEKLPCSHPGCPNKRQHITKSCSKHNNRFRSWGSTCGRLLYPEKDYPKEMALVRHLLALNSNNPAWQKGVQWIKEAIESAAMGRRDYHILTPYLARIHPFIDVIDLSDIILAPMVAIMVLDKGLFQTLEGFTLEWRDRLIGHRLLGSLNRKLPAMARRLAGMNQSRFYNGLPKAYKMAGQLTMDSIGQLLIGYMQAALELQEKLDERDKEFASIKLNTDPALEPAEPDSSIHI